MLVAVNLMAQEEVQFTSKDINLSGTLYQPTTQIHKKSPAIILVHGSGAENRNGTCNLYRKNAQIFKDLGFVVLTYDKRGVNASTGNWRSASFDDLAGDVVSAIDYLKNRVDIDKKNISLWGVSQAGWVMAKANQLSTDIKANIMVGAAGAGVTVAVQNSYNIRTLLKEANAPKKVVAEVDSLWSIFYDLVSKNDENTSKLYRSKYSSFQKLSLSYSIFLPPAFNSINFNLKNQWYTSLELNYDPIEDWRRCNAAILAIFGSNDKYTPVDITVNNLKLVLKDKKDNFKIEILSNGNHILTEGDFCTTPLRKDYINVLKIWASEILNN